MEKKVEKENRYSDSSLERIVTLLLEEGYQLDVDAFKSLEKSKLDIDPTKVVQNILQKIEGSGEPIIFITKEMMYEAIETYSLSKSDVYRERSRRTSFKPFAKEIEPDIKVIKDPTNKLESKGEIEYFLECFRTRFDHISRILRQRLDAREATPIHTALENQMNTEVRIIGMVTAKRETNRAIIIRIEDLEETVTVIIPRGRDRENIKRAQALLLDQIICVVGKKTKDRTIIASEIIVPDIPERKTRKTDDRLMLALTSDLHIGSNTFLEKSFNRFILWLEGKIGGEKEREISSYVKYLTITGDIVDGIGIYPNQERELDIPDIYGQYKKAGEL
ncbi:MAG: hypothetical protein ACTSPB_20085, partial [Candidatus Thorarchaeota archaeon]